MVLDLLLIGLAVITGPAAALGIPGRAALQARREKGAAFVFGWLVSLTIVVTATP